MRDGTLGLCVLISAGVICFALADADRQLVASQAFSESPSPGGGGGSVDEFGKAPMEERARVRATILKYIAKNPSQSKKEKEKLYSLVSRGNLGRLVTVPFATAAGRVSREQLEYIQSRLKTKEAQELLKNPDASLIILGFADGIGLDDMGYNVSKIRAESIAAVLRDECGVQRTVYAFSTGSRISPDPHEYTNTRTAEIWWVAP
jgi:hypothetical protein